MVCIKVLKYKLSSQLIICWVILLVTSSIVANPDQDFLSAVRKNDLAKIKIILTGKSNINAQDTKGRGAVWIASYQGYESIIKYLIDKKADLNIVDKNNASPLLVASQQGHPGIVKLLIRNGAQINDKDNNGRTALLQSLQHNNPELSLYLIRNGANLYARQDNGWSVLLLAVQLDRIAVVRELLKRKIQLDDVNEFAHNIADIAINNGHNDMMKLLLNHGWPVNKKNRFRVNRTALHTAAMQGKLNIMKMLIDHKADVSIKDNNGQTALMVAVFAGQYDAVKFLIEQGARVNTKDNFSQTPLSICLKPRNARTHFDIAKLLKNAGARK